MCRPRHELSSNRRESIQYGSRFLYLFRSWSISRSGESDWLDKRAVRLKRWACHQKPAFLASRLVPLVPLGLITSTNGETAVNGEFLITPFTWNRSEIGGGNGRGDLIGSNCRHY